VGIGVEPGVGVGEFAGGASVESGLKKGSMGIALRTSWAFNCPKCPAYPMVKTQIPARRMERCPKDELSDLSDPVGRGTG